MIYSNPRLKHVKLIKSLCLVQGMSNYDKIKGIVHQCNLLLETKKAKKRKEYVSKCCYFNENCPICPKVEVPDPKEESKKCDLHRTLDCPYCFPDPKEESRCEHLRYFQGFDGEWCLDCKKKLSNFTPTPSRSEELEKIIRNWKTAEFYVNDNCEDEEVSELSQAILDKYILTPIK